jgi:hypothetical protein
MSFNITGDLKKTMKKNDYEDDISKILVLFPEEWRRSKKQYVRLTHPDQSKNPIWLGQKHDYSLTGSKARVEYSESEIELLQNAPERSTLQVRNDKGEYKFEKKNGKWVPKDE